jgi:hypothetical protein
MSVIVCRCWSRNFGVLSSISARILKFYFLFDWGLKFDLLNRTISDPVQVIVCA